MGTSPVGIPSLTLDDSTVPREHQFEAFQHATAPLFDSRPLERSSRGPSHAIDFLVDGLIVSKLRYGGQVLRRTTRHLGVGDEYVSVLLHDRGGLRGVIGTSADLCADQDHVAIIDFSHTFACCCEDSDVIWIMVPRARLAHPERLRPPVRRFHHASPRGRVLVAGIERLWEDVANAPATSGAELAAEIIDHLDGALSPGEYAPDDRSLHRAMKRYIDAHLDDLDLSHESLCSTFCHSRSTVYRIFKPDGGVDSYIRRQRLLRCFDELTDEAAATRAVSAVATRWGFENPSHFNRLFKAAFGPAPSTVVGRPDESVDIALTQRTSRWRSGFRDWMLAH